MNIEGFPYLNKYGQKQQCPLKYTGHQNRGKKLIIGTLNQIPGGGRGRSDGIYMDGYSFIGNSVEMSLFFNLYIWVIKFIRKSSNLSKICRRGSKTVWVGVFFSLPLRTSQSPSPDNMFFNRCLKRRLEG